MMYLTALTEHLLLTTLLACEFMLINSEAMLEPPGREAMSQQLKHSSELLPCQHNNETDI